MSPSTIHHASHVSWDCTYHVVIVPKYRKKVLFGHVRKRAGEIIRQLCQQKDVEVIEGNACLEHIHLILSIPPRHSVAYVMGFLKGKSAILLHHEFGQKRTLFNKNFWARGYFVRTVGIERARAEEYVRRQLEEDQRDDGDPRLDLHWN